MKETPMKAALLMMALATAAGCAPDSEDSESVDGVHMAELSSDFTKIYLTNSEKNEVVVVDARAFGSDTSFEGLIQRAYIVSHDSGEVDVLDLRTLELVAYKDYKIHSRIKVGANPTHLSVSRNGRLLAVMDEDDGAVSFIDTEANREIKKLKGFYTPHFMRFSPDGRFGYVANLGAHHLTRVDLESLEIDGHIPLDGFKGPPNETEAVDEGGFADAQIDADGVIHSAHRSTGRVIRYDTKTLTKLPEVNVGRRPWIVYAEHPFPEIAVRAVPNWGDLSVSLVRAQSEKVDTLPDAGDLDSNGINYTPLAPEKAFVMNRVRAEVAVLNTTTNAIAARIPVGGSTETAATTADGRWIVATVSSINRVVVIDAVTNEVVKSFDNVGAYPWSVTIPLGQNYCH